MTPSIDNLTEIEERQIEQFIETGILKIENPFDADFLKSAIDESNAYFKKYSRGTDSETWEPNQSNQRSPYSIYSIFFESGSFQKILMLPVIDQFLEKFLGKDYRLLSASINRIEDECHLLSLHRDARGTIGISVLLDDFGPGDGTTCLCSGTHFNNPSPSVAVTLSVTTPPLTSCSGMSTNTVP